MATLINGDGNAAVYAQQDADWFQAIMGSDKSLILDVGLKMAYEIEDANTIAVKNGVILTKEGRRIQIDVGSIDEFTIPTGEQGVTNYYIIGFHLYTDGSSKQLCETFVEKMNNATDTIPEATFRGGATEVYVSLYRVTQIGFAIDSASLLLEYGSGIGAINASLTEKVSGFSDTTYSAVTGLAYDATNKKLGLKVGADTVIPFSGGGQKFAIVTEYQSTYVHMINDGTGYNYVREATNAEVKLAYIVNTYSTHFSAVSSYDAVTLTNIDLPGYYAIAQNSRYYADGIRYIGVGDSMPIGSLSSGNQYQLSQLIFVYLGETNPFA